MRRCVGPRPTCARSKASNSFARLIVMGSDGQPGRLPDFLVVGTMKGGTTTLWEYLARHPDVFVPAKKELDYFLSEDGWNGHTLEWYRSQFAAADPSQVVGEVSPNYAKHPAIPGVPARIHRLLPDARLVYILRHPVDRMCSHWIHFLDSGAETRRLEPSLLDQDRYLDVSRYAAQLDQFLAYFARDRILVLLSEALRSDREATLATLWDDQTNPTMLDTTDATSGSAARRLRIRPVGLPTAAESLVVMATVKYKGVAILGSPVRWVIYTRPKAP